MTESLRKRLIISWNKILTTLNPQSQNMREREREREREEKNEMRRKMKEK